MPIRPRVLHVAPEMAPLAKMGGLGDVVQALPKALRQIGLDCRVLLPAYPCVLGNIEKHQLPLRRLRVSVHVSLEWRVFSARILRTDLDGVPVYLLEQPELFSNPSIYPMDLNESSALPFAFLSLAALELPSATRWRPQIYHVHDWPAAMLPVALRWHRHYRKMGLGVDTVLTLHNMAHHGILPEAALLGLGLDPASFGMDGLEFYGQVNLLKGGILTSDAITTVSPRYSWEIQTKGGGMGLEGVLASQKRKIRGILNGIDTDIWNPGTDPVLPAQYGAESPDGKALCRAALLRRLGWEDDGAPLLLWVGRLVEQKGVDLLLSSVDKLVGMGCRLLVIGSGHALYEDGLRKATERLEGRLWSYIGYSEEMAHLAYAGSDLFLMPSLFEPCGLSQLIALRYGTIPVARAVGGLADTIIDADGSQKGYGFLFSEYTSEELVQAVERALAAHADGSRWEEIVRRGMSMDFSWSNSAMAYANLYLELLGVEASDLKEH
ncbi:MAG: glycogen synthase GlgA [Synergistales bacterium]|jgi:starch synthase